VWQQPIAAAAATGEVEGALQREGQQRVQREGQQRVRRSDQTSTSEKRQMEARLV